MGIQLLVKLGFVTSTLTYSVSEVADGLQVHHVPRAPLTRA